MYISKFNKYLFLGFLLLLSFVFLIFVSLSLKFENIFSTNLDFAVLFEDILISFSRVTIVAIAAWLLGIVGGYFLHHNEKLETLSLPTVNFIRHISPFAWLPFAILWFGLGEFPIAFILFITLFFPVLIAIKESFNSLPKVYIDEAIVCGATQREIFLLIELPLLMFQFVNIFRIIWGLGWATIVAAEMLGVRSGLGFRLLDFRYLLLYNRMFYYIIVMGVIGIIFDFFIKGINKHIERKWNYTM